MRVNRTETTAQRPILHLSQLAQLQRGNWPSNRVHINILEDCIKTEILSLSSPFDQGLYNIKEYVNRRGIITISAFTSQKSTSFIAKLRKPYKLSSVDGDVSDHQTSVTTKSRDYQKSKAAEGKSPISEPTLLR